MNEWMNEWMNYAYIACRSSRPSCANHAISDIPREDFFAFSLGMKWKLNPLQMVRQEKSASKSQPPSSTVAKGISGNFIIIKFEHFNRLNMGVRKVERFRDSNQCNIVIELGSVMVFMRFQTLDVTFLVTTFQESVMGSSNNLSKWNDKICHGFWHADNDVITYWIKNWSRTFNAMSSSNNLILVDNTSTTNMWAQIPQRNLPWKFIWKDHFWFQL